MRLLVTRTYLFRRFLSVVYCQLEWVEGGSGVGKGERAVCRLAIQGRVSQNLRLIQVIFGHTASEAKGVCVCVCQCACEMRARESVCVQTRSRPKVTENPTAKQDAAVFLLLQEQTQKCRRLFNPGLLVVFCCLRRKKDQKNRLGDETFSCRNGRWKEPWKVEGRRVCENQTRQVGTCAPLLCSSGTGAVRAARQDRVRQERRSLAQSLGGLGLLPLTYSPRLVPSFTGTHSVAQALGICASALGAAGKSRLRRQVLWGGGGQEKKQKETKDEGRGGLGLDPHTWDPSKRLAGGVFAEC